MTALALAVLAYFAVSGLWDLLEPDAVTIKFGSPFRAVVALAAQFAIVTLCLVVLSATTPAVLAAVAVYVALTAAGIALERQ